MAVRNQPPKAQQARQPKRYGPRDFVKQHMKQLLKSTGRGWVILHSVLDKTDCAAYSQVLG
jgi:hypothetical protein